MNAKLFLVALLCSALLSCSNDDEESFDWEGNAVKIESGKVIAYFPKDSVDESRMNEVAGDYKMTFTNFSTGSGHSFGGVYLEIKPNEFIKYTDQFDDPNLPGEMITSVWLNKVSCGTEIKITQEGIPSVIPAEMCYLGWQESLDKLMKLVEPEIPDA